MKENKKEMSLTEAIEKTQGLSKKDPSRKFYVSVKDSDGNCIFTLNPNMDGYTVHHCFVNGEKVPTKKEEKVVEAPKAVEVKEKNVKSKKEKVMKTATTKDKKAAANKALKDKIAASKAKRDAAKKSGKVATKAKATKPAKAKAAKGKPANMVEYEGAKIVSISIADMRKNIKKGYEYRDPQGVIQRESYLATRARQEYVRDYMQEFAPEK
jgi:outer membrane biosynthesis protein TonB